ncbi:hypothetical protein C7H84_33510 [Burkholderia sp. Nafp2/4-1b]|uniref:hypothetical protein n=1 Tax=Burkholderia sp. Nafp2/4-1b TaxID=2116686 RepID=UPI000F183467|nr:hypothetical protein [Burkholderia sp. Nafp2/4-1b]RKT99062.1 hypothetical protein C7H84_33510 [Burkholderia sp. Nafp2/4-1b]
MQTNAFVRGVLGLAVAAYVSTTHAIVISDDEFVRLGGNGFDIPGTAGHAMAALQKQSLEPQFLAVGYLWNHCTATWIGDTPDGKWSYFLAAAHCVDYGEPQTIDTATQPYTATFTDWSGTEVAGGEGEIIRPFQRLDPAAAKLGRLSTDLALVKLPKHASILGTDHKTPIQPPVLYDGNTETDVPVTFVGYGLWGTGTPGCHGKFSAPDVLSRRMVGSSILSRLLENDHGVEAGFNPVAGGALWARTAKQDGGAPWWQRQVGYDTIVAVASTTANAKAVKGSPFQARSVGPRISRYADWIKTVFPQARFLSDSHYILTNAQPMVVSPDIATDAKKGSVAFTVPPQILAQGPTNIVWEGGHDGEASRIVMHVIREETRIGFPVILRAFRDNGMGPERYTPMNNAVEIGSGSLRSEEEMRTSRLILKYDPLDNPEFAGKHGVYKGQFDIEVRGWHDTNFKRTIRVKVRLDLG